MGLAVCVGRSPQRGSLMASAAVVSRRTVPGIKDAHTYLFLQGYTCIGTNWLRGLHGYAQLENLASGRVQIIEGVA
ncbi:hypothetical protein RRM65_001653 [Aeromonas salmonicida subsp. salmonicida]|nr:hypothetical protein [Aeromonas salmonicida subsp. salmonicida]